ncbi:MAG: hypothetical protein AAGH19_02870 [Pseudomonadota bacterium]
MKSSSTYGRPRPRLIRLTLALLLVSASLGVSWGTALAQDPKPTVALNLGAMSGDPIWDSAATATPLALDAQGKPSIVLIKVPAGTRPASAHVTNDGSVRFAVVLSGTLYYADGHEVRPERETAYEAGSVLLIHSGTKHWVAAREADVALLLSAASPEHLPATVRSQLPE